MRLSLTAICFLSLMLALISCGERSTPTDNDEETAITTDNLGRFGDEQYVLLKSTNLHDSVPRPEVYLWWEKNLGEPFTDVNGNGIYDAEVDSFLVTGGETTDDLNHNGKYDGPDDPWTPGVPFDDIDHDGELRLEPQPFQKFWRPGVPYVDYTGNGTWDSVPGYSYDMISCSTRTLDIGIWYGYYLQDSAWSYVSDSGVTYRIFPRDEIDINFSTPAPYLQFVRTQGRVNYLQPVDGSQMIIPLLDGGLVSGDTGDVETSTYAGADMPVVVRRTIETGISLSIGGRTYGRLVRVLLSDYRLGDPARTNAYRLVFREFYFSPDLGLLAVRAKPLNELPVTEYYLEQRYDALPVPMTR